MNIKNIQTVKLLSKIAVALVLVLVVIVVGGNIFQSINNKPQKVRITNITASSATVSWITDSPSKGIVRYSENKSDLLPVISLLRSNKAYDDRDYARAQQEYTEKINDKSVKDGNEYFVDLKTDSYSDFKVKKQGNYYTHHVTLRNLDSSKRYVFKVGDTVLSWDLKNADQAVTETEMPTATVFAFDTFQEPASIPTPNPAYGKILATAKNEDGFYYEDSSKDSIVYGVLSKADGSEHTQYLSSVTNGEGGWYLDKANARDNDGNLASGYENGEDYLIMYVQFQNVQRYGLRAFLLDTEDTPTADIPANLIEDVNDIHDIFKGFTAKDFLDNTLLSAASKVYARLIVDDETKAAVIVKPKTDGTHEYVFVNPADEKKVEENEKKEREAEEKSEQEKKKQEEIEAEKAAARLEEQKKVIQARTNSCTKSTDCVGDNNSCINGQCKVITGSHTDLATSDQQCVGAFSRGCFKDVDNACYCQWVKADGKTPSGAGYSKIEGNSTCIPEGCYGNETALEKEGYVSVNGSACKMPTEGVCSGDAIPGCLDSGGKSVTADKNYGNPTGCEVGDTGVLALGNVKDCRMEYSDTSSCEYKICMGQMKSFEACQLYDKNPLAEETPPDKVNTTVLGNSLCPELKEKGCGYCLSTYIPCSGDSAFPITDGSEIVLRTDLELEAKTLYTYSLSAEEPTKKYRQFYNSAKVCGVNQELRAPFWFGIFGSGDGINNETRGQLLEIFLTEEQKECIDNIPTVGGNIYSAEETSEIKYFADGKEYVKVGDDYITRDDYVKYFYYLEDENISKTNSLFFETTNSNNRVVNSQVFEDLALLEVLVPDSGVAILDYNSERSEEIVLRFAKVCFANDPELCFSGTLPAEEGEAISYIKNYYSFDSLDSSDWSVEYSQDSKPKEFTICNDDNNCSAIFEATYEDSAGEPQTISVSLPYDGNPRSIYSYTDPIGNKIKLKFVPNSEKLEKVSGESDKIIEEAIRNVKGASDVKVLGVTNANSKEVLGVSSENLVSVSSSGLYNITVGDKQIKVLADDLSDIGFYTELNNVDGYQEGEDEIIKIDTNSIEKVSDIYDYPLVAGINMLSFPFLPLNTEKETLMASELLSLVNQNGTKVTRISYFENGKWDGGIEVLSNLEQEYAGNDFPIYPGKGYLIMSDFDTNIQIPGLSILAPMPVELGSGWNFVGINGYSKMYTAEGLITDINTLEDLTVSNVTWWPRDLGKYEGYQKENGISYGFDYPISDRLGYFIKVSSFRSEECKSLLWNPDGDMHNKCGEN